MWRLVLPALLVFPVFGCSDREPESSGADKGAPLPADIAGLAKDYHHLKLMTPEPVFADGGLAMLCAGANAGQVEAAKHESGPHAHTRIRVFMNDTAGNAFQTKAAAYPVGAVVVKEKEGLPYTSGKDEARATTDGIGGMVKRPPGYDPRHGDWEYFYVEADTPGEIETGRIASCVNCHEAASENDYVFGRWAGPR